MRFDHALEKRNINACYYYYYYKYMPRLYNETPVTTSIVSPDLTDSLRR